MTSLKARAAAAANRLLDPADIAIVRRSQVRSRTHVDVLAQLRSVGVRPATAIDVGAARGDWTRACHSVFPDARNVLLEPLTEFEASLAELVGGIPTAVVVQAAAAEGNGTDELHVHADLVGSSLLREAEGAATDGVARTIRTVSVDDLAIEIAAEPPYIIKVDAQGAEVRVLEGSRRVLMDTSAVILEVSLIPFFLGGPVLWDIVQLMHDRGFAAYDIFGETYRPLDGALAQVDIVFVAEGNSIRADHRFATPAQRSAQDARFTATAR